MRGRSLRGSRRGREKFVTRDFRGDAHAAILAWFDADNFPLAANVDVGRLGHLLGKRDNEIDFVSDFEAGVGQKIQTLVTQIPRVRHQFVIFRFPGQHAKWKVHGKAPRLTALRSITHQNPRRSRIWRNANTRLTKLQRENQKILS